MDINGNNNAFIRVGRRTYRVPGSRSQRTLVGLALLVGGIMGFLPVVGFWMIPLGLVVLSVDSPRIRRRRRRLEVWWGRRVNNRQNRRGQMEDR